MYKANRQRLTDIPYAHNPTDVNKNLFSLKHSDSKSMPQKYERSMPLRKRQQQKFETKHSGILKKICYNFRKNMTGLEQNIKLRIKTH
ncbi:hypothetical protein [Xylanibacter rarus]|uniref:hypothetical protein n=1 Tax=Xylanibacter rarus TaxID=1676614 RepID=UPI003AB9398C